MSKLPEYGNKQCPSHHSSYEGTWASIASERTLFTTLELHGGWIFSAGHEKSPCHGIQFTLAKLQNFCQGGGFRLVFSWQFERSHVRRVRASDLAFKISNSSFKQYLPWSSVSRKKRVSIILGRLSASWAPLWTHLNWIPSARRSFIFRALSWVRNSLQAGGAVRVTRSNRLLQSVATVSSGSLWAFIVAVEKDWGKDREADSGFCHRTLESINHAQHNRIHDNWSKTELRDTVSAASVLVTTHCIFLHPRR